MAIVSLTLSMQLGGKGKVELTPARGARPKGEGVDWQEGENRSFSRADFSQPREMFSIVIEMSFSAFNSADNVRF